MLSPQERKSVTCPHCDEYGVAGVTVGDRVFVQSAVSCLNGLAWRQREELKLQAKKRTTPQLLLVSCFNEETISAEDLQYVLGDAFLVEEVALVPPGGGELAVRAL